MASLLRDQTADKEHEPAVDACLPDAFDPETCVTSLGNGVLITLSEDDYCASLGYPTGPVEDGILCDTTNPPGAGDTTLNPYALMPGEALVKYLPPGKYGIVLIPPVDGRTYNLTSTIEGTTTVDAWILADAIPAGYVTWLHNQVATE